MGRVNDGFALLSAFICVHLRFLFFNRRIYGRVGGIEYRNVAAKRRKRRKSPFVLRLLRLFAANLFSRFVGNGATCSEGLPFKDPSPRFRIGAWKLSGERVGSIPYARATD